MPYFLKDPLWERLEAVEARQRAYGMHDPDCPAFQQEQAQAKAEWQMTELPCSCWLSTAPKE